MEENVQEVFDPIIFISLEGDEGDELVISVAEGFSDEEAIELLEQGIEALKAKL